MFLIGVVCGLVIDKKLITNNTNPLQPTLNKQLDKNFQNEFGILDLPLEYFYYKDVVWGSLKENSRSNNETISEYSQVALNSKAVYQSYPTTDVTIKNFFNDKRSLKIKSINEILEEIENMPEFSEEEREPTISLKGYLIQLAKENYKEYGTLATNYLPNYHIIAVKSFDIDNDNRPETIVVYNYTKRVDAGSYHSDIIKDNHIIFSVQEDNSSIIPADTANGFYIEWRSGKIFGARCCPEGFVRTRFVFKNGEFVPIYEQEVKYLKVGKK